MKKRPHTCPARPPWRPSGPASPPPFPSLRPPRTRASTRFSPPPRAHSHPAKAARAHILCDGVLQHMLSRELHCHFTPQTHTAWPASAHGACTAKAVTHDTREHAHLRAEHALRKHFDFCSHMSLQITHPLLLLLSLMIPPSGVIRTAYGREVIQSNTIK